MLSVAKKCFANSYNLMFLNLYGFKGRVDRKQYIARLLLMTILSLFLFYSEDEESGSYWMLFICTVIVCSQIIPLSVRRLHDIGHSGYWALLLMFCGWGYFKLCAFKSIGINFTFPVPFGQCLIPYLILARGNDGVNGYGEYFDYSIKHRCTIIRDAIGIVVVILAMVFIGYVIQYIKQSNNLSVEGCNLAVDYYKKGEYEESLQAFNAAIESNPEFICLYSGRGATLTKLNRFEDALNDYNKYIQMSNCLEKNNCDIGDIATYKKKIYVLYKQEKYKEALDLSDILLGIIKENEDYKSVYLGKARILQKLGLYDQSVEYAEKVLDLDTHSRKAVQIKEQNIKLRNNAN